MSSVESSVPWGSPKLRAILACTLVLPLGVALISPTLPVVRDAFVLTDERTSLLITLYFLPGVLLAPVVGWLADRHGRRAVVLPSLVAFGLLGGAIAFADSFTTVLVLRVLQGSASIGVFVLTVTFISDVFDGIQRNAVLGINASVLFGGAAIFPFVGGFLAAIDWSVPFLTYFLALPVAAYVFVRLDEPPMVTPRCGPSYLQGAAHALPPGEALALYGAMFVLEAVAFGAILTALPFVLAAEFAAPPVVTGSVITAMMIVGGIVSANNGRLARHRSNHRLVAVSFLSYGVGLFVAWIADSVPVVLAGAAVVGVGFGLAVPSIDAAIARIVSPEYRAGAMSIRTATAFLGRAIGPIAFTTAALAAGYRPLLFASAVGTLAVGAVGLVVTDSHRPLAEDATTD